MPGKTTATPRITKFTNCRLVRGSSLVEQDLWIDSLTGKILKDQEAFYELHLSPDKIIDLGGRIVAPGMIDVQLNGAHGFDFSVPADTKEEYDEGLRMVNKGLARTGVTSYLPTVVSSTAEVYHKVSLALGILSYHALKLRQLRFSHPSAQQPKFTNLPTVPNPSVPTRKAPSSVLAATEFTNQKSCSPQRHSPTSLLAMARTTSIQTQSR